jgi:hypothetical protein
MEPSIDFDQLFALRVMLQDDYENESDIIIELRYELIQLGMIPENIPNLLKNFYEHFGINISLDTINQTLTPQHNHNISNILNNSAFGQSMLNYLTNQIHIIHQQPQNTVLPVVIMSDSNGNIVVADQSGNAIASNSSENNIAVESSDEQIMNSVGDINNNVDDEGLENDTEGLENNGEGLENDGEGLENDGVEVEDDNDMPGLEPPPQIYMNLTGPPSHQQQQQLENMLNNLIGGSNGLLSLSSLFANPPPHPQMFQNLFQNVINVPHQHQMQDVVVTLNTEELNNLKKYKIDKKLEEKCSICMMDLDVDQEICELPCEHKFHSSECIEPYLKQYNYKCPICRKEVGKSQTNI